MTLRELGPAYTHDATSRGRAEAHQRRFRVEHLRAGYTKYGHWLDAAAIARGANFLHPAARAAAEARAAQGKGVDPGRTFGNMLASQAMCFNLFGPLAASEAGRDIARDALGAFFDVRHVRSIDIEYTPHPDVFGDQSRVGGVDCDVLVELETATGAAVLVIETKFVETAFSQCGHRKPGREACPADTRLDDTFGNCRYVHENGYRYWRRAVETGSLRLPVVREGACPFGGGAWQLWVNHTLAHAEAARRDASRAIFAVCAPRGNDALLRGGEAIAEFQRFVSDPSSAVFLPLEGLIARIGDVTARHDDGWREWARMLAARYVIA